MKKTVKAVAALVAAMAIILLLPVGGSPGPPKDWPMPAIASLPYKLRILRAGKKPPMRIVRLRNAFAHCYKPPKPKHTPRPQGQERIVMHPRPYFKSPALINIQNRRKL